MNKYLVPLQTIMLFFNDTFSSLLDTPYLTESRVIVLEGPGGSGKSVFANEIASKLVYSAPTMTDVMTTLVDGKPSSTFDKIRLQNIVNNYGGVQQGDACFLCDHVPYEENQRRLVLIVDYAGKADLDLFELLQNPYFTLILMVQNASRESERMKFVDSGCYLTLRQNSCSVWVNGNLELCYENEDGLCLSSTPTPSEISEDDADDDEFKTLVKSVKQLELRPLTGKEMTALRRKESSRISSFVSLEAPAPEKPYSQVIVTWDNFVANAASTLNIDPQRSISLGSEIAIMESHWEDAWFTI